MKLIEALYHSRLLEYNRLHDTTCLPYETKIKQRNRVIRMAAEYHEKKKNSNSLYDDPIRSIYVIYRIEPIDDFGDYTFSGNDKKIIIQEHKHNSRNCTYYPCDTLFECKVTIAFLLNINSSNWKPYGYCDGFPF